MRTIFINIFRALLVSPIFFCTQISAHGSLQSEHKGNLKELIEGSNLIASGRVTSVKYVNIKAEGEGEIPHTIVTYKLQESFRGKRPSGDALSLLFVGGSDGKGNFLSVSGVPQFQKGEEDILFVSSNGSNEQCPLMNCEYGRYRIHQNQVYNTHGQPVRGLIKNDAVARGARGKPFQIFRYPTPEFDELIKNPVAKALLVRSGRSIADGRKQYNRLKPKNIKVTRTLVIGKKISDKPGRDKDVNGRRSGRRVAKVIGDKPITKRQLVRKIKKINNKSRRRPKNIKSFNPSSRIVLRSAQKQRPRNPNDKKEPAQRTSEDKAEVQALKSQRGNPVLKRN